MALPARVAVVGGGTMGSGIALEFVRHGTEVIVLERDDESVASACARLDASIQRANVRAGDHASREDSWQKLSVSSDFQRLSTADLVIEAVPEQPEIKADALRLIEDHVRPETPIATNTSSLSISRLSESLRNPASFLGLHFFNPVASSLLVEIVAAENTADELITAANSWVEELHKTSIVVRDSPGFATSRLGLSLALEAMRMLEENVASAEDIDQAMVLGYRHATGPLRTTDLVGLDVRLGIARYLASTLGDRFNPPRILLDKVAAGQLGRKTGKGFFSYV